MQLAGQVIDIYDDSQLSIASTLDGIEKWASTEVLSAEDLASIPDNQFGIIVLTKLGERIRKFPLTDDGNVWLSSEYFDHTHTKLSSAQRVIAATHIKRACDAHDIPPATAVMNFAADEAPTNIVEEDSIPAWLHNGAEAELTKSAALDFDTVIHVPDGCYALSFEQDGEYINKYAMPDKHHVKVAADYFSEHVLDFSPEHRHMYAQNVVKRAEDLSVDVSDNAALQKWAGEDWNNKINWHLEQRKSLLSTDEEKETLEKLAGEMPSVEPEVFAQALGYFDKQAGIDKYYDRAIADPYAAALGLEKTGWSQEIDDDTLTAAELNKIAGSDKIKSHFGESFRDQFKKHAIQIFESLPKPEQIVIKQIAKGEI